MVLHTYTTLKYITSMLNCARFGLPLDTEDIFLCDFVGCWGTYIYICIFSRRNYYSTCSTYSKLPLRDVIALKSWPNYLVARILRR